MANKGVQSQAATNVSKKHAQWTPEQKLAHKMKLEAQQKV